MAKSEPAWWPGGLKKKGQKNSQKAGLKPNILPIIYTKNYHNYKFPQKDRWEYIKELCMKDDLCKLLNDS